MTQILELSASELVQKVRRGEVPLTARVQVTFEDDRILEGDRVASRLVAWQNFVRESSAPGAVVDDSREAIYDVRGERD